MAKFNFLMRDWKEQIDAERLNEVLTGINEAVRCVEADTGADYYLLVIHTADINLSAEEWNDAWKFAREGLITDRAPENARYIEATEAEIRTLIGAKQSEEATEESRISALALAIINAMPGLATWDIVDPLDTYTRQKVWEKLLESDAMNSWSVRSTKILADRLGANSFTLQAK